MLQALWVFLCRFLNNAYQYCLCSHIWSQCEPRIQCIIPFVISNDGRNGRSRWKHIDLGYTVHCGLSIKVLCDNPDSKVHGANMGPIWARQDPGGPDVGPMSFAIWEVVAALSRNSSVFIVRRAGLLWSQQDFEWLWSVPLSSASLY